MTARPTTDVPVTGGRLFVVGTGIRAGIQLTPEARQQIVAADRVFYQVGDPIGAQVIEGLNANAEALGSLYGDTKERSTTYDDMVDLILGAVRAGQRVCAAFYGHPGVVVAPGHEAIRQARQEGFEAIMLPGISAEDCLFADLGINPGDEGCQTFKAHDFLLRPRSFDVHTPLVLWQPVVVGESRAPQRPNAAGIEILSDELARHYGPKHQVVVYVAAIYPVGEPEVCRVSIDQLPSLDISMRATLYVPPLGSPPVDHAMRSRLELAGGDAEASPSATAAG